MVRGLWKTLEDEGRERRGGRSFDDGSHEHGMGWDGKSEHES